MYLCLFVCLFVFYRYHYYRLYKYFLFNSMNRLFYNGVIDRLKTKNTKMMKYDGSTYESVSYRSIHPVIDLLKIGLAISICILIIELLFQRIYFFFNERRRVRINERNDQNLRGSNRLDCRKENFIL